MYDAVDARYLFTAIDTDEYVVLPSPQTAREPRRLLNELNKLTEEADRQTALRAADNQLVGSAVRMYEKHGLLGLSYGVASTFCSPCLCDGPHSPIAGIHAATVRQQLCYSQPEFGGTIIGSLAHSKSVIVPAVWLQQFEACLSIHQGANAPSRKSAANFALTPALNATRIGIHHIRRAKAHPRGNITDAVEADYESSPRVVPTPCDFAASAVVPSEVRVPTGCSLHGNPKFRADNRMWRRPDMFRMLEALDQSSDRAFVPSAAEN